MPKFLVDFEFAGHIEVEAESKKDAIETVAEKTSLEKLLANIQHFNVGKYYAKRVDEKYRKDI